MSETIYPKGIMTFARNEKAPEFVLGSCVITIQDFKDWVNSNQNLLTDYNGKKQIRLSILKGKDGRVNFTVDTFKPRSESISEPKPQREPGDCNNDETDLPF